MSIQKSSAELFKQTLSLLDEGAFEQGQSLLEQTLLSARQEENRPTLISALVCMADLQTQLDAYDQAQALLDEVFAIEKLILSNSPKGDVVLAQEMSSAHAIHDLLLCRRLFNQALDFLEAEQLEEGEDTMRQAIALAQQKSRYDILLAALICMADMLIQLDRKDEAQSFLEQALAHEKTGHAQTALPAYQDSFEDNFARARELLALI